VKEKPTVGSPFFGAFPSDCIPAGTNDVSVLIHSFTFRDEVVIDNALAVKKKNPSSVKFPFLLSIQRFFFEVKITISIKNIAFFFCISYKKYHVSSPVIMLLRKLSSR